MGATVLVLDFDNTLVKITHRNDLFSSFGQDKIPAKEVKSTYADIHNKGGFSPSNMLRALKEKGYCVNEAQTMADFDKWLSRSVRRYGDAASLIRKAREVGMRVVILTYGVEEYQKMKIAMSGILHDEVIVVDSPEKKVDALAGLKEKWDGPLLYLDDSLEVISVVARSEKLRHHVIPVFVSRSKSPVSIPDPNLRLRIVKSLSDPRIFKFMP